MKEAFIKNPAIFCITLITIVELLTTKDIGFSAVMWLCYGLYRMGN